jgi:hypothetical protein
VIAAHEGKSPADHYHGAPRYLCAAER